MRFYGNFSYHLSREKRKYLSISSSYNNIIYSRKFWCDLSTRYAHGTQVVWHKYSGPLLLASVIIELFAASNFWRVQRGYGFKVEDEITEDFKSFVSTVLDPLMCKISTTCHWYQRVPILIRRSFTSDIANEELNNQGKYLITFLWRLTGQLKERTVDLFRQSH